MIGQWLALASVNRMGQTSLSPPALIVELVLLAVGTGGPMTVSSIYDLCHAQSDLQMAEVSSALQALVQYGQLVGDSEGRLCRPVTS